MILWYDMTHMIYNFDSLKEKLTKSVNHVRTDLASLRTGKATPQLLDTVMVQAYGGMMKVVELASVTAPDPTLLVITPWDKNVLESVEKAIASAGLNLNPVVDGDIIRIAVPPLTEERRKEMVKTLHQKIEAGKVMLRNIRVEAKKEIEKLKGSEGVSEDDVQQDLTELEDVIKEFLEKLDQVAEKKESDLMSV